MIPDRRLCDLECKNGGTCDSDGTACSCPSGFGGKLCDSACSLQCKNGGRCSIASDEEDALNGQVWGQASSGSEFCKCPLGFVGPTCEFSADVCGNGEHICLHGTACVPDQNEVQSYRCECPVSSEQLDAMNTTISGSCSNHRTEFCTPMEGHLEYFGGMAVAAFCVNDGKCSDIVVDGQM